MKIKINGYKFKLCLAFIHLEFIILYLVCKIKIIYGYKSPWVGSWVLGLGPGSRVRVPGPGSRVPGPGSRVLGPGSWVPGLRVPGPGSRVPGPGSRVPGLGSWVLVPGPGYILKKTD